MAGRTPARPRCTLNARRNTIAMTPPLATPATPNVLSPQPAELVAQAFAIATVPHAFQVIDLTQARIVASGSERDVYEHPTDPNLLIKIVNRARANEPGRRAHWHKKFHREQAHRVFLTELIEYVSTTVQRNAPDGNVLLSRIAGLVNTSAGLGLAVEKIVDESGHVAPTLQQVVKDSGFPAALRRQVRDFFVALTESHVIFNDVSARNIVVGRNADGVAGLYLVDGYGPKQLLPFYAWSKSMNRRRIMRKYVELEGKLERMGAQALSLKSAPASLAGQ